MAKKTLKKHRNGLAHFEVCGECGKHGRIVFPDGRTGGEIGYKSEAGIVLQYAMLVDKFQNVDIFPERKLQHVLDEIQASTLTVSEPEGEVGWYFRKQLNTWNTAKLHQPNLNPADFHKVMTRLYDYRVFDN